MSWSCETDPAIEPRVGRPPVTAPAIALRRRFRKHQPERHFITSWISLCGLTENHHRHRVSVRAVNHHAITTLD